MRSAPNVFLQYARQAESLQRYKVKPASPGFVVYTTEGKLFLAHAWFLEPGHAEDWIVNQLRIPERGPV